jgi:hypothetical protein
MKVLLSLLSGCVFAQIKTWFYTQVRLVVVTITSTKVQSSQIYGILFVFRKNLLGCSLTRMTVSKFSQTLSWF